MGTRRSAFVIEGRRNDYAAARPAGAMLAFEVAANPGLAGALCAAVEPELFFPERGDHKTADLAREICARCPVIEACLADALKAEGGRSHSSRFGIRGGLSPNQRYHLARRMRRASQAAEAALPASEAAGSPPVEIATASRPSGVQESKPAPCGTRRGYLRHRREGEDPCEACLNHVAGSRRRRRTDAAKAVAA
ncbi:WhiB family transcriptional regulator [Streptomyces sp. XH2]|uniref:WhiB family transcriptional regulator n=1 Tax=Streptomyces sp. XH2 TaxID=3412483 RepID=UPI003C79C88B